MIEFNDLKKEYQQSKIEVDAAVVRVLESGWYILGKEVEAFEDALGNYLGTKHVSGVASGTDALALALLALGTKAGDEIITIGLTAFPTINAIQQIGATPVVCDVEEGSGLLDPQNLASLITSKTKVVIPVHLYGNACDMDSICKIAKEKNIFIIEDCAQSIGAKWNNKMTGTFGDLSCFSFYPTKNLGAYGDGGAVATNSKELDDKIKKLRNYGQTDRYLHSFQGINSRLDEIQAAILSAKLSNLEQKTRRRRKIAEQYKNSLPKNIQLNISNKSHGVYHLFPVLVNNREEFMEYMEKNGVKTLIHYPIATSDQDAFLGFKAELPNVNKFTKNVVSLPLYPELNNEQIAKIMSVVNGYFK